jgi:hypothetical protein
MDKDEALKLALEALELLTDTEQTFGAFDYGDNAITAIKEVLAQPAQRPWVMQREWVDLTDEEIDKWTPEIHGVIREVIAQFKERNA